MNSYAKLLLLFALCHVSLARMTQSELDWNSFKVRFQRKYENTAEEMYRKSVFLSNIEKIEAHNKLFDEGKSTFKLGITQFADLTENEFTEKVLAPPHHVANNRNFVKSLSNVQDVPDSIDWRDKGVVTPVKDQGQCGDAVSFGTTGAVEGQHALATGTLVSLSEENLAYCTNPLGGCSGGLGNPPRLYDYIINNNGQDAEGCFATYDLEKCYSDTSCKAATISSYNEIMSGDEDALKTACGTYGPIAAIIDASHASFQLYISGVYNEPACSSTQLDHSVLIVGYGNEGGNDYWMVKNSWGTSWGNKGYIEMSRNKDNQCGIASGASWPTV